MLTVKLLIIDDDINVLSSLGKTFTTMAQGFLVLTATSANEGYAMLKEQRPDVVVLDVRLGPKSGMDLLKDFSDYFKSPSTRKYQPRYIVITAYPDEKIKREAEETYGVDSFLMKPFRNEEIRRVVMLSVEKVVHTFLAQISPYTGSSQKDDQTSQEQTQKELRDKKLDEEFKRLENRER